MKYKVIGVVTLLITGFILFFANYILFKIVPKRVDQHINDKVENNCKKDEKFCTHLPIVSITFDEKEPELKPYIDSLTNMKAYESTLVSADFSLYYNGKTSNRLSDKPVLKEKIMTKYRGNSSLDFDKHQYLLKFVDKNGNKKEVSMLGMQNENSWILNGPYLDKTLLRNYVSYNIAGKILDNTPEVRYCEVFVNGEYKGVYLLVESISRELTKVTKYKPRWSNGMTSYIIRVDRKKGKDKGIYLNNLSKYTNKLVYTNYINIEYPGKDVLNDSLVKYIEDDFNNFEKMLYSYDYKKYPEYIDTNSFVDYMIINEFFKNSDAGTHSTYLYKDIRGKINIGPVWDFNNSANNYVEEVYSKENFMFQDKTWYDMLLKDERFTNKVIKRYKYLRKNILSDKYIQNYIDDTVEYLDDSIDRNFEVWGYTFTEKNLKNMLRPYSRNYKSYKEALEQYKDYLHDRGEWLDQNIDTLKQYSHYSINKIYEGK